MTQDTTISLSLLFSIISVVAVILTILNGIKKNQEQENNKEIEMEKNFLKINMKIDQFFDTTNKILKSQEKATDDIQAIRETLSKEQEQIRTLFKNQDDIVKRICRLEGETNE
jgi:DNA anti-recombination protein RmuC